MVIGKFIIIGENIHCSREYKVNGIYVKQSNDGIYYIAYKKNGQKKLLPVPEHFLQSSDWHRGCIKHCAAAIWQGFYGNSKGQEAGIDYIKAQALNQKNNGAYYLDINIDEFSTDLSERIKLIKWIVKIVKECCDIPICIDSSNFKIMEAGLSSCTGDKGKPLINSVSLEREYFISLARTFGCQVIASAAGPERLPDSKEERLLNLRQLMHKLEESGISKSEIFIDPLVFPVGTNPKSAVIFLDTIEAIRKELGKLVHIGGGFSNISFGMPKRNIINQVFSYLAIEKGADSGIVNPLHINPAILSSLDTDSLSFRLVKQMLLGEDEYGLMFIKACRQGRI